MDPRERLESQAWPDPQDNPVSQEPPARPASVDRLDHPATTGPKDHLAIA